MNVFGMSDRTSSYSWAPWAVQGRSHWATFQGPFLLIGENIMFATAINGSYAAYQNRFEWRDRLIQSVLDTTVNVCCEAEVLTRDAYDWVRDTQWDDAIALMVTGLLWIIAAYIYVVLQITTQVWQCWEQFQADTLEQFISVEALSAASHCYWHIEWSDLARYIWWDIQAIMDAVYCLDGEEE